jgi:hypothetical protein
MTNHLDRSAAGLAAARPASDALEGVSARQHADGRRGGILERYITIAIRYRFDTVWQVNCDIIIRWEFIPGSGNPGIAWDS